MPADYGQGTDLEYQASPPKHTTPIADPSSATIGEPDMPPAISSATLESQSGPLLCFMAHRNHRASRDMSQAAPLFGGSPMASGFATSTSASYASHSSNST